MEVDEVPAALPRRFWAVTLRGTIACRHAVKTWVNLRVHPSLEAHFRRRLALVLRVRGRVSHRGNQATGRLGSRVQRERLLRWDVETDSSQPDYYNLPAVVTAIRGLVRLEGFHLGTGTTLLCSGRRCNNGYYVSFMAAVTFTQEKARQWR
ncbi:hypothetical protein C8Q77DRAFT_74978 [Trametes polyzona]|nr:hypothetical protein C8Q77DRAFT_74978 [Trametes polyzona]